MKIELFIPDQVTKEDEAFKLYFENLQLMVNRMAVSHYKYGEMSNTYPDNARAIDSVQKRVNLYDMTGNLENVLDAANFLIIEACFPSHHKAHFRAQSSQESPGIVYIDERVKWNPTLNS